MIEKLFKSNESGFYNLYRLILNKPNRFHIFYSHKYITATQNNSLKILHGRIYGFRVENHVFYDDDYYKKKNLRTVDNLTINEMLQKIDKISENINNNTIKNNKKKINELNISMSSSSLYIYNNTIYFDPSMQLLDLFNSYIDNTIERKYNIFNYHDMKRIVQSSTNDRNVLINQLYKHIPINGIPLVIEDIEEIDIEKIIEKNKT